MFIKENSSPLSPSFDDMAKKLEKNINKPKILYDKENQENPSAIVYNYAGKKYIFSNEEGHKVSLSYGRALRPMSKKEFKDICTIMLNNSSQYGDEEALILSEIEKLDFGIGHANSTFEVIKSSMEISKISALALNIGTGRYLYNQKDNTVYHIDHSKLINGTMMKSPEKDEIIKKITDSKTMTKKISKALSN